MEDKKLNDNDLDNIENLTLEETFSNLEEIVNKMEGSDISLEESFELYNKGINLVKNCNSKIDKIEKDIKVLGGENINE